jgi:hypothetical protein
MNRQQIVGKLAVLRGIYRVAGVTQRTAQAVAEYGVVFYNQDAQGFLCWVRLA